MFCLNQEERVLYISLSRSIIYSLKSFHATFNSVYNALYEHTFIFEGCCECYGSKQTFKTHDNLTKEMDDNVGNVSNIERGYSQIIYEDVYECKGLSFSENDVENFKEDSFSIIPQAENFLTPFQTNQESIKMKRSSNLHQ